LPPGCGPSEWRTMTAEREAARSAIGGDDGQPDLPNDGHAELPGGGQRDYLV
jgi:hypothetical protein